MNFVFKNIKLHNFGPFQDAEVNLIHRGFCLVSGENNCLSDNAASNGSGKSFIWSGICYALTGETIQGTKSDLKNKFVPDNDMYVELSLEVDGDNYLIKRGLSPSKFLTIIKNDIDVSGKTYTESLAILQDLLPDVTKSLITSCILLGQGLPERFSMYSPSGRKDLLEKLTKSDFMIAEIKEAILNRLVDLNKELRAIEDDLLVTDTKLVTEEKNINKLQAELSTFVDLDFDALIAEAAAKKEQNEIAAEECKAELAAVNDKVDLINKKLVEKVNEKNGQLNELFEGYSEACSSVTTKKLEAESSIKSLTVEINRLKAIKDVCPTCGQKLPNVVKPDTTKQESECEQLKAEVANYKDKLIQLEQKNKEYQKNINDCFEADILALNEQLHDNKKVVNKLTEQYGQYCREKAIQEEAILKYKVDQTNYSTGLKNVQDSLEKGKQQIAILQTAKEKLTIDRQNILTHIDLVKKMETASKRDFRGYLLIDIINSLAAVAKQYSSIVFGTELLEVKLEDNAIIIKYKDKPMENLSGGEKARVDLILQLSIRNLLKNYLGFNSNILVLDEVTDFLDVTSCAAMMNLFEKELNTVESVFIVSHHTDTLPIRVDSELFVIKHENEISEIH